MMSDGDDYVHEFEPSGWIRDYVASVVVDPDTVGLLARQLEIIATEDEE